VICDLAIELTRLAAARDTLAVEIEEIFTRHPQAPVLLSIPGIGHGPEPGSSPRSVKSPDSRLPDTSPPTPAWRR
jgi:hypothetical protein